MQEKDIITISATDPLYPDIFKRLHRPPAAIHARGNIELLSSQYILAIVGTRRSTPYGREITTDLSRKLAANGAVIVSGLAHGIDSIAHKAALDVDGKTIAVLPSGLNNVYPAANVGLANQILKQGGLLLSEYSHDVTPDKYHFVERNRLVAALCNVLLVTEAAYKSGTFHTVTAAQKLNKTIAAVPGNITSPMSKGVNKLFYDGAQPILESADLLSLLGLHEKTVTPKYKAANSFERVIVRLLRQGSKTGDQIIERSNLEASTLSTHLTMLEIKGIIEQIPGNKWRLAK